MKIAAKILFAVLFCSIPVCSQQPVETDEIRVETSLVSVPVRVTDRRNRNITGLEKKNFRVYEDGIEQTVESFEDNNAPLTVAIMLDASNSTTAQLKNIKAAAAAFLDRLRPHDRVMIFSFDRNLVKIADGTIRDLPSIQNSISLSQTGGGTSLYDSVVAVNQNYLGEIGGRKALIILTDGIDTQSVSQTSAGSLRAMEEADVLVYSIQYDTVQDTLKAKKAFSDASFGSTVEYVTARGERLPAAFKNGTLYLNFLTDSTGGKTFYADTTGNLSKTFAKIALELSQVYSLSYYPTNQTTDGKRRKIKTATDAPKTVVQSRRAYVYTRTKVKSN